MDAIIKQPLNVEIPVCDINNNIALQRLRINPLSNVKEPPVYCRIGESPAMTAGNFSLINGKAKSGKTFLVGSIVAGMLVNTKQLNVIEGYLPVNKKNILYFDTEQSTFHATRSIKRICAQIGKLNPINLIAYGLRPLTPAERLAAIEDAINQTENLGIVVIDGVRDLLTKGINDEEEATTLTSKFLKWTSEFDIHLILILHQNKTDLNPRGHIGTELINKAETTLSVTKDKSKIFVVSCEYSRDIAFDDFGFIIENGNIQASGLPKEEKTKSKIPNKIEEQKHLEVLDLIFKTPEKLNYSAFQDKIISGFDFLFGKTASRGFITYYLKNGWITTEKKGSFTYYNYSRASF